MALIRAAGGIPTRTEGGAIEYLAVHRPRHGDWTWPKGKLDPGETSEAAAVREVEEETGWQCSLGPELPTSHYLDRYGRQKAVRYWLMTPVAFTGFTPNAEIDDARWIGADEAAKLLTYDADRRLLDHIRSESS